MTHDPIAEVESRQRHCKLLGFGPHAEVAHETAQAGGVGAGVKPGTVEQLLPKAMAVLKSAPVQFAKTHCPIAAPDATQRHCRSVRVGPQADAAQAAAHDGTLGVWPLIRKIRLVNVINERSFMMCPVIFVDR